MEATDSQSCDAELARSGASAGTDAIGACPSLETVAAWCLGELVDADAERFEEHYGDCDGCAERATRMQVLIEQLHASTPPGLSAERPKALHAAPRQLRAVRVQSGERATMRLGAQTTLGVWVMQAQLNGARRVDFEARDAAGTLLFELPDMPFDAVRGEVVLACQVQHRTAAGNNEMHVRLTATSPDGRHPVASYVLHHQFERL